MILLKSILIWLLLAVTVIAIGMAREMILSPRLGSLRAHQVGTLLAVLAMLLVVTLTLPWLGVESTAGLLAVGGLWLGLTIAFEFVFGHYVMGHPWSRLLADYNLLAGRIWSLFLVALLLAPLIARSLRSLRP